MTKKVIREIIIALLICLAILLILSVALYNYIPGNKVVPETVEYTPTKEIQTQLNAAVEDNSNEILMTYEITAQDLENYQRTNEYIPGKSNPFAAVPTDEVTGTDGEDVNSGTQTGDTVTPNGGSSSNNNHQGGSLFEGGSSK